MGLKACLLIPACVVGNIFLSIFVSAVKVQILDLPNWLVADWREIPFMRGYNPEFGIFDLFKCACACAPNKKVGNDGGPKKGTEAEKDDVEAGRKRGCCCRCCCCCNSNYCCGMFSQAGFLFIMGLVVGFPAAGTYTVHKKWFQDKNRNGVVRVDDSNLKIFDRKVPPEEASRLINDSQESEVATTSDSASVPVVPV